VVKQKGMKQGLPVLLCILDILFQADFLINLSIQIEEVLQIIFHGMSEMKVLCDQCLFKKKSVLLQYLNMFQNTVSCLYIAEFHPVLLDYN
jgi:hypothetical protein